MHHFSQLDLVPIPDGATVGHGLANSLRLAQHAEQWGYDRFWVAEHHNMPGIASAATAVVMGYLGGGTTRLRVGAGLIMWPNHARLQVAEAFGAQEPEYLRRIDLPFARACHMPVPVILHPQCWNKPSRRIGGCFLPRLFNRHPIS